MTHENDRYETAIIGCGLIGASWAALLSSYGRPTRLWDAAPGWVERARVAIAAAKGQLARLGLRGEGDILYAYTLQEAVSPAGWIQECISEDLELKGRVFREVGAAAPEKGIIASSTSSFTWSQLARFVVNPSRLITAHPFNPPHLVPLVEIYSDNAAVGETACEFFLALGRRPILLRRDATGHVANRLASALWREAVHVVAEGIASVADVDSAMVNGPGLRWSAVGPYMAYHLGGGSGGIRNYLHHLGNSQVHRWAELGSPTLNSTVREVIASGVEQEAAGRSIDEIARVRDEMLIAALCAREGLQQAK